MSSYAPWKALERRTAKLFKGYRIWRQDYSETKPDGVSEAYPLIWDCKAWSKQAVVGMFAECEKKYRVYAGKREFILVLFDPTRKRVGDLVVCRATRYAELLAKEEMADGTLAALTEFDPPPEC